MNVVRPETKVSSDFDLMALGGNILVMMLHFIFWTILLIFIELGVFDCFRRIPQSCNANQVKPRTDLNLDNDVVKEELRVE